MSTACPIPEGTLSDYTDNALSPVARLRVRRHLNVCAPCAARVLALESLNRQARGLYADTPAVIPALPRSRRVLVRPLLAVAASAALAAVWFAPEMPGRPRVAFADVENAMRQVKTAHWTETLLEYGDKGKVTSRVVSENWARINPPLIITRSVSTEEPSRLNSVSSEKITYTTQEEQLIHVSFGGMSNSLKRGWVRFIPSPKTPFRLRKSIENDILPAVPMSAQELGKGTTQQWTQKIIPNGDTSQLYFRCDVTGPANFSSTCEWWADTHTRHISRRAAHWQYTAIKRDGTVGKWCRLAESAENFRYNEPIPDSILALKPPPGAKVQVLGP